MAVRRAATTVLQIDSLEIGPGFTAIIGPNGSGKSTLLHAIAGLLPSTGRLRVLGSTPLEARRQVAYVLQAQHASEHLLVTAGEVVALGRAAVLGAFRPMRGADRRVVDEAMRRLDVHHLAGRHLAEMSGGQRQRVFVSQGLAQQAPILLLDEPVAGLDVVSSQLIREAIAAERAAGRTVVVATHDLADAARADQVALLDQRLVAAGPPDDVLTAANLRLAYGPRVLDLGDGGIALDDGVHHDDHEHHHHDEHHHHEHRHHEHRREHDQS